MATTSVQPSPSKKQIPILARHAVSLSIAFVLGLVLSYFIGQYIYQQIQLGKLSSSDQATFERGLGYVVLNAGTSESVTNQALQQVEKINPQRAADLLLAITQSHADREDADEPTIPTEVGVLIGPLMKRLSSEQAIGLYDGLVQIKGVNPIHAANDLLNGLNPKNDAELLKAVDLLDTRLLWSKQWAPLDLWVRWLGALASSESELTQAQTAKRLGELPDAVDDPRVLAGLTQLVASKHETVRNIALNAIAGYAAIAEDPTDYEQLIFRLGQDKNKTIARRAWMIVGHLDPTSGLAVNWKNADPFIAEAMLWSASKTNLENTDPIREAIASPNTARLGLLAADVSEAFNYIEIHNTPGHEHLFRLDPSRDNLIDVWRALLAFRINKEQLNDWEEILSKSIGNSHALEVVGNKAMQTMAYGAMLYRDNGRLIPDVPLLDERDVLYPLAATEGKLLAPLGPSIYQEEREPFIRLIAAASGTEGIDLDRLVGELALSEPTLLDLFTLALTKADNEVLDRFIRSSHPQMVTMAALASAIKGYTPQLIEGVDVAFLRKHPDLDVAQLRSKTDAELALLGLRRIDALPELHGAAKAAPPSANRSTEAKLLQLALWVRGDLSEALTPTIEAMLFDQELPTSTVLMCLLHHQRPAALNYLFGNLATQRPNLQELFIQKRFWHVLRRFIDTSDLTLWLWGDPEAQAFQLEAMRQWYAVNRWKIEQGWWPEPKQVIE